MSLTDRYTEIIPLPSASCTTLLVTLQLSLNPDMLKRLLLGYALIVFFLASGSPIVEQHIANTLDGLLTAVNGTVVGLSDAVNENLNLSLRAIIAIIPPGPLQTSFIQLLNDVEKLENSVAEDKQTVISNIRKVRITRILELHVKSHFSCNHFIVIFFFFNFTGYQNDSNIFSHL